MMNRSDNKRLVAGSWFVGLALAFALSFGFAGQALADDQITDSVPSSDPAVIVALEPGDETAGEEVAASAEPAKEEAFSTISGSIPENQPTAVTDTIGVPLTQKGDSSTLGSKETTRGDEPTVSNDTKNAAGTSSGVSSIGSTSDEPENDDLPPVAESDKSSFDDSGEADANVSDAPSQDSENIDATGKDAVSTSEKESDAASKQAADKAKSTDKASEAANANAADEVSSARGTQDSVPWEYTVAFETAYEQAASEVQAESEPAEQPAATESIKTVRWSGGSNPAVPALSESNVSRTIASPTSSQFAITPEKGLPQVAGNFSLSNSVHNCQGALLYSKAHCRSP